MSKSICGIVMPISAIEDCDAQHWSDVKDIISDAIREADYEPQLVSTAIEVNIIQARIIQNLYQNPIVVCDVSCKNANVMFELGMRLAFDKPTIVIKDDQTGYSFDTSPIEHLTYPRSLRHGTINKFKEELVAKIKGTMAAKDRDPDFSPFLKSFGPFKAANIETKEVPAQEMILDMLTSIMNKVDRSSNIDTEKSLNKLIETAGLKGFHRFVSPKLSDGEKSNIENDIKRLLRDIDVVYEDLDDMKFIKVVGRRLTDREQHTVKKIIYDNTIDG